MYDKETIRLVGHESDYDSGLQSGSERVYNKGSGSRGNERIYTRVTATLY